MRARMVAAVRVSNRRWNLTLKDGATVLLPEGEEVPAIHRLAKLHASTHLLDRPVVLIDMRLPDRLTIREKPPEPAAQPDASGKTGPDTTPGHAAQQNSTQGGPSHASAPPPGNPT